MSSMSAPRAIAALFGCLKADAGLQTASLLVRIALSPSLVTLYLYLTVAHLALSKSRRRPLMSTVCPSAWNICCKLFMFL
jgi:hypothetical protein